ncbi:hypothetical protein A2U01_0095169, partial [Trifolium medium]|nr:hypothetical protein [Trifolium medium]
SSVQVAAAPVSGGKRKTTAEGTSSVVASRKSDRPRESTVVAMEAAQWEENRGGGRKRMTISDRKNAISCSEEEENG